MAASTAEGAVAESQPTTCTPNIWFSCAGTGGSKRERASPRGHQEGRQLLATCGVDRHMGFAGGALVEVSKPPLQRSFMDGEGRHNGKKRDLSWHAHTRCGESARMGAAEGWQSCSGSCWLLQLEPERRGLSAAVMNMPAPRVAGQQPLSFAGRPGAGSGSSSLGGVVQSSLFFRRRTLGTRSLRATRAPAAQP